jgi:hypothetical protein
MKQTKISSLTKKNQYFLNQYFNSRAMSMIYNAIYHEYLNQSKKNGKLSERMNHSRIMVIDPAIQLL